MSNLRLYELLPAAHRARDVEQGEPLRALVDILQEQFDELEEDTRSLYENLFVETCDEWVLPYLGELVGVPALNRVSTEEFSLRGYVGNMLRYRRRKGTAPVLEQVARDLTGWPCRVVEFFQLLGTTQSVKHVRLQNARTPDLRQGDALELLGTPFETAARTVEVRRIARERGRYGISNVGLFLWRLRDWTLERSEAIAAFNPADGRYRIDPLALGVPLFNRARTETEILNLAAESDVPGRLRRRPLWKELEQLRRLGDTAARTWFDERAPFHVYLEWPALGAAPAFEEEIPPEQLSVCDLSDAAAGEWHRPDGVHARVAVDPVLGRLSLPAGTEPSGVRITWAYASPGRYGGGPYERSRSLELAGVDSFTFRRGVLRDVVGFGGTEAPGGGAAPHTVSSLAAAVAAWNSHIATATESVRGLIVVLDNSSYDGDLNIELRANCTLVIASGQWLDDSPVAGVWPRARLVPDGRRPHVRGNVRIETPDAGGSERERVLVWDGLLLDGVLAVAPGQLDRLRIAHSTLVPERGALTVEAGAAGKNGTLVLELDHSWVGSLRAASDAVASLSVADSIVDASLSLGPAIDAPSSRAVVLRSTVLGASSVRELEASDAIFSGDLLVERRQTGCLRYSFCPALTSLTPRRFRCQPDLALAELEAGDGWSALDGAERASQRASVLAQVSPMFASTRYGDPNYGMLAVSCHTGIRRGAENSSEMGAFAALDAPLREANLRASLDDFLPFGLEAGVFFVT